MPDHFEYFTAVNTIVLILNCFTPYSDANLHASQYGKILIQPQNIPEK